MASKQSDVPGSHCCLISNLVNFVKLLFKLHVPTRYHSIRRKNDRLALIAKNSQADSHLLTSPSLAKHVKAAWSIAYLGPRLQESPRPQFERHERGLRVWWNIVGRLLGLVSAFLLWRDNHLLHRGALPPSRIVLPLDLLPIRSPTATAHILLHIGAEISPSRFFRLVGHGSSLSHRVRPQIILDEENPALIA